VEAEMTVETVLTYRGNLIRKKHYMICMDRDIYRKDKQVVVITYSKMQVLAAFGCEDNPGWLSWRVLPLDEPSAEMNIRMGRRVVDLTNPNQEEIDWLNKNMTKK
jgi:hypothetical protein